MHSTQRLLRTFSRACGQESVRYSDRQLAKENCGAGPKARTPPASVAAISRVVGEKRRRAAPTASAAQMAAPAERAAVKALADQRAGLEAEMEAVLSRLNAPGMPGVSGRLVDAEVRERRCGGCAFMRVSSRKADARHRRCHLALAGLSARRHRPARRAQRPAPAGGCALRAWQRALAGAALSTARPPHSAEDGLHARVRRAGAQPARAARRSSRRRRRRSALPASDNRAQAAAPGRHRRCADGDQ